MVLAPSPIAWNGALRAAGVEISRFRYEDQYLERFRTADQKFRHGCPAEGQADPSLDAGSAMRQEDCGGASKLKN